MWLKEENRMLACIWRQGSHLAGPLRKIVGIAGIHRQANLALVIEDDGITLLEAEWVDDRSALGAANAALSGPLDLAGRPEHAASWALLINERIIAKSTFVGHHCTGGGCQREHAHRLNGDSQSITDSSPFYGHWPRYLVSTSEFWGDHWTPAARRNNTTDVPTILNCRREALAWTNESASVLIYKDFILDFAVRRLHGSYLLSLP